MASDNYSSLRGGSLQVSTTQLNINVANQPVSVGNKFTISAAGCSGSKIAAMVFEQHHHYGTETPKARAEPDSNSEMPGLDMIFETLKGKMRDSYSRMWWKPLPFLQEKPLTGFYVNLKYDVWNLTGSTCTKDNLTLKGMLREITSNNRFSLVTGVSGCGKTTLLTKMVNDWATGEQPSLSGYDFVILYQLRNLPKGGNLEVELNAEFLNQLDELVNLQQKSHILETFCTKKTLFLLDGCDELDDEGKKSLNDLLSNSTRFIKSTFIVTSRHEEDEEFLKNFQNQIRILSLTKKSREKFVEKYFQTWCSRATANKMKKFLAKNTHVYVLFKHSPLLMSIFCSVLGESSNRNANKFSNLIPGMVRILIALQAKRNGDSITETEIDDIVISLGKFFWEKLQQNKYTFSGEELENWFNGNMNLIMSVLTFQPSGEENTYDSLNKSFPDALACHYLNSITGKLTGFERKKEIWNILADKIRIQLYHGEESVLVISGSTSEIQFVVRNGSSISEGHFDTSDHCKLQYQNSSYKCWMYPHTQQRFVHKNQKNMIYASLNWFRNSYVPKISFDTFLNIYETAIFGLKTVKGIFYRSYENRQLYLCFNEDSDRIELDRTGSESAVKRATSKEKSDLTVNDLLNVMFCKITQNDETRSITPSSNWILRLHFLNYGYGVDIYRYQIVKE